MVNGHARVEHGHSHSPAPLTPVRGDVHPVGRIPTETLLTIEVFWARQSRSLHDSVPLQFGLLLPLPQQIASLEGIAQAEAKGGESLGFIDNLDAVQRRLGGKVGSLLGGREADDDVAKGFPLRGKQLRQGLEGNFGAIRRVDPWRKSFRRRDEP